MASAKPAARERSRRRPDVIAGWWRHSQMTAASNDDLARAEAALDDFLVAGECRDGAQRRQIGDPPNTTVVPNSEGKASASRPSAGVPGQVLEAGKRDETCPRLHSPSQEGRVVARYWRPRRVRRARCDGPTRSSHRRRRATRQAVPPRGERTTLAGVRSRRCTACWRRDRTRLRRGRAAGSTRAR